MEDGEKSLNSPPLPPPHRLRRSPSASQGAIKSQRTTETKLLHRRRREQSIKCTSGNRGRQARRQSRPRPWRNTPSYWAVFGQILLKRVSRARAKQLNVPRPLQSPLIAQPKQSVRPTSARRVDIGFATSRIPGLMLNIKIDRKS